MKLNEYFLHIIILLDKNRAVPAAFFYFII